MFCVRKAVMSLALAFVAVAATGCETIGGSEGNQGYAIDTLTVNKAQTRPFTTVQATARIGLYADPAVGFYFEMRNSFCGSDDNPDSRCTGGMATTYDIISGLWTGYAYGAPDVVVLNPPAMTVGEQGHWKFRLIGTGCKRADGHSCQLNRADPSYTYVQVVDERALQP